MKHILKKLLFSCLLLFFVLFQATSTVHANQFQTPENDISVNISVDKASIMVNESTTLRIEMTNQSSVDFLLNDFSFTLPAGLEFSSGPISGCVSGGSQSWLVENNQLSIQGGSSSLSGSDNCLLSIDVKGVLVNNYSLSIGANTFTAYGGASNSTGASTTLSVTDSNNNTATPTPTATDSATATPVVTNTPIPTDTATTQPTNTQTGTSVFTSTTAVTSTHAVTSTPGAIATTKLNQAVAPTQTRKPTKIALVLVVTPTNTDKATSSLTATKTTTTPTSIASTPTLPAQTTDPVPDALSTEGNLPISLLLGGGLLLLGAVGYGIYSLIKK